MVGYHPMVCGPAWDYRRAFAAAAARHLRPPSLTVNLLTKHPPVLCPERETARILYAYALYRHCRHCTTTTYAETADATPDHSNPWISSSPPAATSGATCPAHAPEPHALGDVAGRIAHALRLQTPA